MKRLLYICLVMVAAVLSNLWTVPAVAQLPSKKFVIFKDEEGKQQDGVSAVGLDRLNLDGVKVYVTWKASADSIEGYGPQGRTQMLNAFTRYYDDHNFYLEPDAEGVFDLANANWIADDLYDNFPELIDWWIKNDVVKSDKYSVALIIYSQENASVFEKHDIDDIINNNSSDFRCPVYYRGSAQLKETVTTGKMKQGKIRKSTIVKGSDLPINERFHITGKSFERLIVDRFIKACDFEEDFIKMNKRFRDNKPGLSYSLKFLGHEGESDTLYRQTPYVFAGEDFQKALYRRTGFNLKRDTLEHYRQITNAEMGTEFGATNFKRVDPDTVNFELDQSLWYTACQYKDFEPVKNALLRYSRELPKDGGKPLANGEIKEYSLRVDTATFNVLSKYVDKGHLIAQRNPRTSEDQFIPGWISTYVTVDQNDMDSVEYDVRGSSILRLQDSAFHVLRNQRKAVILRKNDRDSVYRVRVNSRRFVDEFEDVFVDKNVKAREIYLTPNSVDVQRSWSWEMPDPQKYYKMMHVNYRHDFIHVDTVTTIECPCDRMSPLQFLRASYGAAGYDCPPMLTGGGYETFIPISGSRDPQTVNREARLQFDLGSSAINPRKDNNEALLAELKETINDILYSVDEDSPNRRIDSIKVIGIASPEGVYARNAELSRARAQSLIHWIKANCFGTENCMGIAIDSVATWQDVVDIMYLTDSVGNKANIDKFTSAIQQCGNNNRESVAAAAGFNRNDQHVQSALDSLRKVKVFFYYQDIQDPTEDMVLKAYVKGNGRNWETFDAYYYFMLLNSDQISHAEKIKLSKYLLELKKQRVAVFRTATNEDWFDLVLPIAANMIVSDSLELSVWNTDILRPFIDENEASHRGNAVRTSRRYRLPNGMDKVYKYINLDFILFNQIQMLLGKGDQVSLNEASVLIQILENSATMSEKFQERYKPKTLSDYLKCRLVSFSEDAGLAERMKATNIVNYYVVNMSIVHEILQGGASFYTDPRVQQALKECYTKLPELEKERQGAPDFYYFTAVTEARYAECFGGDNKKEHYDKAIAALVKLFKSDKNATFISRCQGDFYVRNMYSTQGKLNEGFDIYLEAVEAYINECLNNDNK